MKAGRLSAAGLGPDERISCSTSPGAHLFSPEGCPRTEEHKEQVQIVFAAPTASPAVHSLSRYRPRGRELRALIICVDSRIH